MHCSIFIKSSEKIIINLNIQTDAPALQFGKKTLKHVQSPVSVF